MLRRDQRVRPDRRHERCARRRSELRHAPQQIGMRRRQLEPIQRRNEARAARHPHPSPAVPPAARWSALSRPGRRRRQVRRQLLGRDVIQHDLQPRPGLQPPRQQLDPAPQRLRRLELRAVQHAPHRLRQRGIHPRDQRILPAVRRRDHVWPDQTTHQVVDRRLRRPLAPGQPREIGQPPVGRQRAIPPPPRRPARQRFRTRPAQHLLGRGSRTRRWLIRLRRSCSNSAEQRHRFHQLVRMEIVHGRDRDLERALVAELHRDPRRKPRQHVVEIVDARCPAPCARPSRRRTAHPSGCPGPRNRPSTPRETAARARHAVPTRAARN